MITMSEPGKTDWAALDALTEEDVVARGLTDPDNLPLTKEDLARMPVLPRVTFLCHCLGLSAEDFARRYCIPSEIIRDWQNRATEPDAIARTYLRLIDKDPDGVARALGTLPADHPKAA